MTTYIHHVQNQGYVTDLLKFTRVWRIVSDYVCNRHAHLQADKVL